MRDVMVLTRRVLGGLGAVVLTLTVSACSDLFGSGTGKASVSFNAGGRATASTELSLALVPVTGAGHTLDVQSIDVVLDEVTLERDDVSGSDADSDDSDADSDSDGPHNARVRVGASTVSLPLQGGVITPFTSSVPTGTYSRLEMDVRYVRVRGTYDGQAFDVTMPVNAEYELQLSPPLVVAASGDPVNVTVNFDALSWFRNADGSPVDPVRLQGDATYRAAFLARIKASLRATEDSDRDGDDSDSDSD